MEQIRVTCQHPLCPCKDRCCQDCGELGRCRTVCERVAYKEAIYSSNAFLVAQIEELGCLSGHWLIQVAAQRLKALDPALIEDTETIGLAAT